MNTRGSEWRKWDLHVHTASSYDHKYKSADSDDLLVKAWRDNEIAAVAITDHFLIDADRITKLKQLAPEMTILPGIELRCDKGTSNLHVIIIFPEQDLHKLANKFNVLMRDTKAKNKEDDNIIYWDYNEIITFAKDCKGIITVHAGKKDKGIDDGITNHLEVNMAIKAEIAENTDMFEMGKINDLSTYNEHVFKKIKRKPMIVCSDNHDPRNYIIRENLWIKADTTFQGLLQAIKEPSLRFFVGEMPPKKKIINDNGDKFIDSISIKGSNSSDTWFDDEILLSSDLVTIIGNKGNGKSALADIIGHSGNTHNTKRFSFLSTDRFNQKPEYLGKDYNVTLRWKNGVEEKKALFPIDNNAQLEKVKYLPQQYIEYVCNDLKDGFKEEIERLIFDYLPREEKLGMSTLTDLIKYLTSNLLMEIDSNKGTLKQINEEIINKEIKITDSEKQILKMSIEDLQKQLEQENTNKPKDVIKPNIDPNVEKKLNALNNTIENLKSQIQIKEDALENLSKKLHVIETTIQQIVQTRNNFEEWLKKVNDNLQSNGIEEIITVSLVVNYDKLRLLKGNIEKQITSIKTEVSTIENDQKDGLLILKLKEAQLEVAKITGSLSQAELNYQNYLQDLTKWREKIAKISEQINKLREETKILEEDIPNRLEELYALRKQVLEKIYLLKKEIVEKYAQKYSYINKAINELEMKKSEKPSIEISFYLERDSMERAILNYINQNIKSIFRGKEQATENLSALLETIDINNFDSIFASLENIENELKKSASDYNKVFIDKLEFFNNLYGLDYIKINYELKLGDKHLNKLSPGERGLLLLIFYLILDKENSPLIIDQPEDNLDNQSVYDKLVPYIIKAKDKRQIIIVTHNPNIAVACDSEQVIYSGMDKENLQIKYHYGSMESEKISNYVVDVLEGTMPAFEKRSDAYTR
ncbi:hypothetical protein CACET_c27340 [Clostridium aceticum]|uniref:Uncharacterized protein n=1 Tax=Clostridium aceticum TaxID=84022 RepID=A0A0D8I8I0_9CLOT|nr:hypothetical protein [Clostridium aceticum]AKL96179.1 hypothetical protein CACET_c27340 [Clostridium aceticum]KJF26600.1 hypothetical protein TZ02_12040 [Clostridium aceticum]